MRRNYMPANSGVADAVGAYLREINDIPVLTVAQEVQLSERMKEGDEGAKETLIKHNLRLAVAIARKYVSREVLPFADLIAEGNRGLMTAAKYYDHEKGRFSPYAGWWINQKIIRAIHETRGIRRSNAIYPYLAKLTETLNQLPRNGFSFSQLLEQAIEKLPALIKQGDPVKGVRLLWEVAKPPLSLDASLNNVDGGAYTRKDFLESHYPNPAETTVQQVDFSNLRNGLEGLMNKILSMKEREIIKHRFGFYSGGRCKTLIEISKFYGVTRERIRQIEARALKKLRESESKKNLAHYLESSKSS